jgi:hypothetical protein
MYPNLPISKLQNPYQPQVLRIRITKDQEQAFQAVIEQIKEGGSIITVTPEKSDKTSTIYGVLGHYVAWLKDKFNPTPSLPYPPQPLAQLQQQPSSELI